ncbi:MAG: NUDIX hydrolase [Deltaproteobacteria bacterium]|nr:NUDIX hydrolase [Deltaproteobacteria bacterium]
MAEKFRNPLLTVDIIIEIDGGIVLIERKNIPHGWAIPGGFVDYGESIESAAAREAEEETSLKVKLVEQFYTYSDPRRDARHHTVSTVFIATANGIPRGADDAKAARIFCQGELPEPIVFDHEQILRDYFEFKKTGQRPKP